MAIKRINEYNYVIDLHAVELLPLVLSFKCNINTFINKNPQILIPSITKYEIINRSLSIFKSRL